MDASVPRLFAQPESRPRYLRERTYDVAHIRLDLSLDEKKRTLEGSATLRLAPINDDFRRLDLDLAANLRVGSVRIGGGRALDFDHVGDRLTIQLGRTYPAGRDLEVTVHYAGTPRRGLYFVGPDAAFPGKSYEIWSQGQDEDSKYWFPCYDSPNDKATSEVRVTVRAPYIAISNGKLVEIVDNRRAKTRTFHWREDFPHPAYLTSVVVGDYTEVRHEVDGIPLSVYVHAADVPKVERTFGNTGKMLRYFADATGYPYPYEKYAQVVVTDFIFGGMENISATTLTDAVLLDATAALDAHCDGLIAHELAHQWWGNLLTCKEWSHAWLNEGFATYFDALFTEHHRGRDEFLWQMHENAQEYFREDEEKYRRPLVERRYDKPIEIFDRHLYEKGSLVLHMLRFELGETLFWKAIRHYARKHQFQNVETTDFKVAIEEATGHHLDGFFDQWVYGAGFPVLEVSWKWDPDTRLVALKLRQTQNREPGTPPFDFALDVEVAAPAEVTRHRLRVDAAEQTLYVPSKQAPRFLRVDPDHRLLARIVHTPGRTALLEQLHGATDLFGQIDAAAGLSRFLGDSDVVEALAKALRRPAFFAARRAIAQALGRLQGTRSRDVLLAHLIDPDLRTRRGIVRALAEFKEDAVVAENLRKAWKKEKSYFVRAEILTSLSKIGGAEVFEFLLQGLRVESFRDVVRAAALRGLAQLEDGRGIDAALPWSRYGHSRWARDAAMRCLATLARVHTSRARQVQDQLETYLGDASYFAVLSAAEALGKLGRSQAQPALHRLQRSDVDGRLQKAAREAMEALESEARNPEAWKSLRSEIRQLQSENQDLRARIEQMEARFEARMNGSAKPAARTPKARATGSKRRPTR